MTTERTLILVKPDGVHRRLVGTIIDRFERRGLKIVGLKMFRVTKELSRQHYAEHVNKPFYPGLREFITGGPLVALVLEGDSAIEVVRTMNGATDPRKAAPGTVRGDLALETSENLVHASDSAESAKRELELWFPGLG